MNLTETQLSCLFVTIGVLFLLYLSTKLPRNNTKEHMSQDYDVHFEDSNDILEHSFSQSEIGNNCNTPINTENIELPSPLEHDNSSEQLDHSKNDTNLIQHQSQDSNTYQYNEPILEKLVMEEQEVIGEQVMGEQVMGEQIMEEQVMGEQVMEPTHISQRSKLTSENIIPFEDIVLHSPIAEETIDISLPAIESESESRNQFSEQIEAVNQLDNQYVLFNEENEIVNDSKKLVVPMGHSIGGIEDCEMDNNHLLAQDLEGSTAQCSVYKNAIKTLNHTGYLSDDFVKKSWTESFGNKCGSWN